MRASVAASLIAGASLLVGCGKSDTAAPLQASQESAAAQASASATSVSSAPAAGAASASASQPAVDAPPAAKGDGTFKGSFNAKVGAVSPPKEAEIKLWAKDPGSEAVGEGSLTLKLIPSGSQTLVRGGATGALGELELSGEIDDKFVTAHVTPKQPNAPLAMTGVFSGKLEGAKITGKLRVSGRDGNLVREADVELSQGE